MTSHFYIPYAGNKYREMTEIYPKLNLDNVETIVEPFAGTCAMSHYIWRQNKDKNFKFIINDLSPLIFGFYQLSKDPKRQEEVETQINEWVDELNKLNVLETRKTWYNSIKNMNTFESNIFINKYYTIRYGLCPNIIRQGQFTKFNLSKCPIHEFFNTADITFTNSCGISTYDKYRKDKKALILLDPPYLLSDVNFYQNSSGVKIYEHLGENKIEDEPAKIYLIVENTWIMKLLFKNCLIHEYPKKYENKQVKTIHGIFSNIKL